MSWVPHHQSYSMPAAPPIVHAPLGPPPPPFMHIPYTESPMIIPMAGGVDLIHQQHNLTHQPIMNSQPPVHFYNNNSGGNNSSSGGRSTYNRYGDNGGGPGMRKPKYDSNQPWREREVTKIPPRFQKQK